MELQQNKDFDFLCFLDLLKDCYNSSKIIDFIILFYDNNDPKNYQNIGNYQHSIDKLSSEEFKINYFSIILKKNYLMVYINLYFIHIIKWEKMRNLKNIISKMKRL